MLPIVSSAFVCKKSKSQIESVMAQTESVAYMTNFVRCHIETQFKMHKYLKMQGSVL